MAKLAEQSLPAKSISLYGPRLNFKNSLRHLTLNFKCGQNIHNFDSIVNPSRLCIFFLNFEFQQFISNPKRICYARVFSFPKLLGLQFGRLISENESQEIRSRF